jgi:hypothetical protein
MAGKKKGAKKAASAPATRSASAPTTEGEKAIASGKLHRAVWHKGAMYDPKRKGDTEKFAAVIKAEKEGGKHAQRLADKGIVSGFGTRGKGKKGEEAVESAGESESSDALGGGLEGSEEAELTEEEEQE